jgi:hypothetical protein
MAREYGLPVKFIYLINQTPSWPGSSGPSMDASRLFLWVARIMRAMTIFFEKAKKHHLGEPPPGCVSLTVRAILNVEAVSP